MLLGPGQPTDRLCSYLVAQEAKAVNSGYTAEIKTGEGGAGGSDSVVPWPEVRLHILDTIGVMCKVSNEAVQTVVSTGAVRCVLGLLRLGFEEFGVRSSYASFTTRRGTNMKGQNDRLIYYMLLSYHCT